MSKILIRFVRDDAKTYAIDDTTLGLVSASGLDEPNIEIYKQSLATVDGDIITGTRVGSRIIDLTAKIKNTALNEIMRRLTTSFFSPAHTYEMYVTRGEETRYAKECHVDSLEIPTENQNARLTIKIAMLMPEGYWLSLDSFGENIAGVTPRCGYPYISYAPYGRIYGVYAYAGTVYLDNDGDSEAFCQAVFTANGAVTNPKIITSKGYVRVIGSMVAGDILIIDGQKKSVTLNGVNVSNKLDRKSDFSGLIFDIGTNSIAFSADTGSISLDVNIYYNKRYLGV